MNKIILLLASLINLMYTDAVCDKETLIAELQQDLEDNGILDCLREIRPPHNHEETILENNLRLAA